MRKIWIVLLAVLTATALFGCGEASLLSPDEPVTLTMWHVYGEQADSPMNRLIAEFNATVGKEKGIVVTVTNVTSTSKILTQLVEARAGGPNVPKLPDLFSAHTITATEFGEESLLDWHTQFSETELEAFVPQFLEDGMIGDALAVFPVSKSSYALFLNGSQFARFSADTGVTCESLATWEGFFDAAAKYYAWSGGKPFCALDYLIRHVELDMMARRGEVGYTADGWYDRDDASFYESWMKFAEPLAKGHIAVADQYANTQVMTGETLGGIGSTAAIAYYNETVTYPDNTSEPTNLIVLPLPKSGDGVQYMPVTGVGICAMRTTDQKAEAAGEFVRWLTTGERNLGFAVETGYMPVHNDAFAAIDSYDFADEAHASLFAAIKTMREGYVPVVRPDFAGYYDKVNALYADLRELQPVLKARADAGEAIETLTAEIWALFCSIR